MPDTFHTCLFLQPLQIQPASIPGTLGGSCLCSLTTKSVSLLIAFSEFIKWGQWHPNSYFIFGSLLSRSSEYRWMHALGKPWPLPLWWYSEEVACKLAKWARKLICKQMVYKHQLWLSSTKRWKEEKGLSSLFLWVFPLLGRRVGMKCWSRLGWGWEVQ